MNRAHKVMLIALAASLAGCGGDSNPLGSLTSSLMPSAPSAPQAATYAVGGTVQALKGTGLVLQNNGATLPVGANGTFKFAQQLPSGSAHSVSVQSQPSNPPQGCAVTNGSGTVGTSAVTNIVVDCTATAASTAVGSPVGQPSTKTIDASGGSLSSPDGRLTLTIPPNAVGSATRFSIQPITNQSPGGIGSAYRLGPEGLTFTAPVQISFQYSSADIAGSLPGALQVSSQNSQGYWVIDPSIALDTTQQTVTATVAHFSDWSLETAARLTPGQAVVPVGGSVKLTAVLCLAVPYDDGTTDGGPTLGWLAGACGNLGTPTPAGNWAANGVTGGNAQAGTVSEGSPTSATYQAPSAVPQANPVAVSANLDFLYVGSDSKQKSEKIVLVSNVTVTGCAASDNNCEWQGTASGTVLYLTVAGTFANATLRVTVTWKPLSEVSVQDLGLVILVPASGTVSVSTDAPGCYITPSQTSLGGPNEGSLSLNFTSSPAQYSGSALVPIGAFTETCTVNGKTLSGPWEGSGVNWFNAPSTLTAPFTVKDDGTEIDGEYGDATESLSWNFKVVSSGS